MSRLCLSANVCHGCKIGKNRPTSEIITAKIYISVLGFRIHFQMDLTFYMTKRPLMTRQIKVFGITFPNFGQFWGFGLPLDIFFFIFLSEKLLHLSNFFLKNWCAKKKVMVTLGIESQIIILIIHMYQYLYIHTYEYLFIHM